MDEINDAFERLERSDVRCRSVIGMALLVQRQGRRHARSGSWPRHSTWRGQSWRCNHFCRSAFAVPASAPDRGQPRPRNRCRSGRRGRDDPVRCLERSDHAGLNVAQQVLSPGFGHLVPMKLMMVSYGFMQCPGGRLDGRRDASLVHLIPPATHPMSMGRSSRGREGPVYEAKDTLRLFRLSYPPLPTRGDAGQGQGAVPIETRSSHPKSQPTCHGADALPQALLLG